MKFLIKNQYLLLIFLFTASPECFSQSSESQAEPLNPEFHKTRREELRKLLPENSVAVVFAAQEKLRAGDVEYPFHQFPDFFYLTGINEASSVLFIFKESILIGNKVTNEVLLMRERNPSVEVWTGKRLGTIGAEKKGFSAVFSMKSFESGDVQIPEKNQIFFFDGIDESFYQEGLEDEATIKSFQLIKKKMYDNDEKKFSSNQKKLIDMLSKLREIKTKEEIALERKAIDITGLAHLEVMHALDTTMNEYHVQSILEYVFHSNGAEILAFPSIVGSGENTCILHYTENNKQIKNGELIVVDIGAEYHGYAADVTRTIPANGKYSPEQKLIYQLVYDAQKAGIEASMPGNSFSEPDKAAKKVISEGLFKLGITNKESEFGKYSIHGTSHYVGLDVHDAGTYRKLQDGNIITVEPGIYIPAGSDCDQKWWNIGVRIEDDVLITEKGFEVLSSKSPKTIVEIEKEMSGKQGSIFKLSKSNKDFAK